MPPQHHAHPESDDFIDASHEMITVGEITNGFRHSIMKNNFMQSNNNKKKKKKAKKERLEELEPLKQEA
jgi:hypothetical protein